MPYSTNVDLLLPSVRAHLPEHPQDIARLSITLTPRMPGNPGRKNARIELPGLLSSGPTSRPAKAGFAATRNVCRFGHPRHSRRTGAHRVMLPTDENDRTSQ